jgi:plastocyanin
MLCAHTAFASTVTLNVKTPSGGAAEDTIIVFDSVGGAPPLGHDEAVIDQINKRFVPRVSVIRTGTAVTFPNGDHIRHQVYSFSPAKVFNLKLYAGSPKVDVVFDKPGLVVLGCNIHDTMVAFVAVVDSPYFGKVPPSGILVLNLPPDHYRLRVWHPNLSAATAPQEVSVTEAPLAIPLIVDLDMTHDSIDTWH